MTGLNFVMVFLVAITANIQCGAIQSEVKFEYVGKNQPTTTLNGESTSLSQDQDLMQQKGRNIAEQNGTSNNQSCPTWMTREGPTLPCKCGHNIFNGVKCQQHQAYILDCYCMTYDEIEGAVVGKCFYRCAVTSDAQDMVYHPLPTDPHQLNEDQCGDLNRDGRLCGSCKEGYSPLVYSYDIHCKNCTESSYNNIIQFVAAAFGPLTLFYMFVVVFQFNANSPRLYGFFVVAQAISIPVQARVLITALKSKAYPGIEIATRIIEALYGIWNLDFFRTLYSNAMCFNITPLQALALDYIIAFYPLALLLISCILIKLHSRGIQFFVRLWRPFQYCLDHVQNQLQTTTSMIEVIATFLLLSYTKLLNVTVDLLLYTQVYNKNGTKVGTYLYYDASVEYFGKEHLPYAITAIFVLLIFGLLPVLLLFLYPMKWFQKFLNCTNLRSRVMDTFIDSFQGFYKDGTEEGVRDCRFFSAFIFLIRILLLMLYSITLNVHFYAGGTITLIAVSILYIIFKPYKKKFGAYNKVDASMLLIMAMLYATVMCIQISLIKAPGFVRFTMWLGFFISALPLVYITVITVHFLSTRTKVGERCIERIREYRQKGTSDDIESSSVESERHPLLQQT